VLKCDDYAWRPALNPLSIVKKFVSDRSGNFGFLTAILIPVLLMATGFAVDFSNGMNAKRQLQAAADGAALAVSTAYTNGITDDDALKDIANRYLKVNANSSGIDTGSLHFNLSILSTTPKLARVEASGKLTTLMSSIFGFDTMDIAARTTSTIGSKVYYQIAFLLDVSGSMAIGATDADIDQLQATIGCQFACHDPGNYNGGDKAAVAKSAGIKLKFDYVQSALNIFVDTLKPSANANPGYYKLGIYTLGTAFSTYQPMTTDMHDFDSSAASVYLEPMIPFSCLTHNGITNIENGLDGIIPKLTDIGDGTSAAKRKTYLVLITDGVQDTISSCGRQISSNYGPKCTYAKSKDINVISIQTNYPDVDHPFFDSAVKPQLPTITNVLKDCASNADSYFSAADGPAIETAIKGVFKTIFGDVRIDS